MSEPRILALWCHVCALLGVIYAGISGERWPLWLVALLAALGIMVGVGEALRGGDDDV